MSFYTWQSGSPVINIATSASVGILIYLPKLRSPHTSPTISRHKVNESVGRPDVKKMLWGDAKPFAFECSVHTVGDAFLRLVWNTGKPAYTKARPF